MSASLRTVLTRMRRAALAYPEAWPDRPWDEWVAKVGTKIFAWLSTSEGELWLTVKLPLSGEAAITLLAHRAEPTAYNLGKSGWVTAHFSAPVPEPLVLEWIEESYRAVAPRRYVKRLDAGSAAHAHGPSVAPRPTRRRPRRKGRA